MNKYHSNLKYKRKKCCHHQDTIHKCPKCGFKGIIVPSKTVIHLSQNESLSNIDDYYLCTNPRCNTVYFSNNVILEKQDISTKIWFKSNLEDFIVCYCKQIKLVDIIKAVSALNGCNDKEQILKYLNKNLDDKHCELMNPVGDNCDKLFNNAIEYACEAYKKGNN